MAGPSPTQQRSTTPVDWHMNRSDLPTLIVAVCCVLAIGTSSATLTSAVRTTPDQAINLGYETIPLGRGTIDSLKARLGTPDEHGASIGTPLEPVPEPTPSDRLPTATPQSADGGDHYVVRPVGPLHEGGRTLASGGNQPGRGEPQSRDPLAELVPNLAAALVLVLLGLVIRFRRRLYGAVTPGRGRGGTRGSTNPPAVEGRPRRPSPSNDVERAWVDVAGRLGLVDRPDGTPRECVHRATERGVDRPAIETLTRVFEEVRYGGAPVTDHRRRLALEACATICDQLAAGDRP